MNLLSLAPYGIAKFTYVFAVNVLESNLSVAPCYFGCCKPAICLNRFFELQALGLQAISRAERHSVIHRV
jgi:hypothetical protein